MNRIGAFGKLLASPILVCLTVYTALFGGPALPTFHSNSLGPIMVGKGSGVQVVADDERIWLLSFKSRHEGGQDLTLHEVDPISLRPVSTRQVNKQPGDVRVTSESSGLLLRAPDRRALYAFWNEPDTRQTFANRLVFSVYDISAGKWGAPLTINDDSAPTTHSFQAAAVGADGVIHVAWIDRRHYRVTGPNDYSGGGDHSRGIEPSASLYYSWSTDGGRTFAKNRYITGLVCACCRLAFGFSKGNVVIAWRSVEPGEVRDIFTTYSSDNGSTWAKPQLASRDNWVIDGCPHVGPSLASTSSALHLAWLTAASGKPELYVITSKDGGRTFNERTLASGGINRANHPRLIARGDRVGIAFEGKVGSAEFPGRSVIYRELGGDGAPSPPTVISNDHGVASYPALAEDRRGLLIAWTESIDKESTIYLRRY
jgi:hypothetical protein